MLRAQIAFASSRRNEAAPLLLAAARRLEPLDAALARETYLDAFTAAMFAGRLAGAPGLPEVAEAARRAPPSPHQPRKADMLLDGLAVLFTDGYAAATPICRRALRAFCSEDTAVEDDLRWLWLASITAADLWDDETWYVALHSPRRDRPRGRRAQRAPARAQLTSSSCICSPASWRRPPRWST